MPLERGREMEKERNKRRWKVKMKNEVKSRLKKKKKILRGERATEVKRKLVSEREKKNIGNRSREEKHSNVVFLITGMDVQHRPGEERPSQPSSVGDAGDRRGFLSHGGNVP